MCSHSVPKLIEIRFAAAWLAAILTINLALKCARIEFSCDQLNSTNTAHSSRLFVIILSAPHQHILTMCIRCCTYMDTLPLSLICEIVRVATSPSQKELEKLRKRKRRVLTFYILWIFHERDLLRVHKLVVNSVRQNECNPIHYLQSDLFSGKIPDTPLSEIFSILDGFGSL